MIAASMLGILAACGSTPTIGGQAAQVTTTIPTTTTTTIPPTTTTTIDFNRPVDQDDTPIPEDATAAEILAIVEDLRGQTDDLHQQMIRLVGFPDIASPIGTQILDVTASIQIDGDDVRTDSVVLLRTPGTAADPVGFFSAELAARGWNEADFLSTPVGEDGTLTTLVYRWPGRSGDEEELTMEFEVQPGVAFIEMRYHVVGTDEDPFDLMKAWQDAVRTPSSADEVEARIETAEDTATLTVRHILQAETAAEAREDIIDLVRSADFETTAEASEDDASAVTLVGVENGETIVVEFEDLGDEETVEVTVRTSGPLTPID